MTTLNQKTWYRALKVVFVSGFLLVQLIGVATTYNILENSTIAGSTASTNHLTSTLTLQQLQQNIDFFQSKGMPNPEIQSYVNNYAAGPNNTFVLKTSTGSKYSVAQLSGFYFLSFLIVCALFWLISRIFFYVFAKESFFKLR